MAFIDSKTVRSGLFHRAVLMSGSGAAPWSLVEDPVHYAVKLAAALNCSLPTNMLKNHLQLVDCLRYMHVHVHHTTKQGNMD
jgi:neuroligin